MGKVAAAVFVNILFFSAFIFIYFGAFYSTLADDIEISAGRKTLRKIRKKHSEFWEKFMFIHFFKHISKYHYFLFLCFIITYPIAVILLNLIIIFNTKLSKTLFLGFGTISFVAIMLSTFARWNLYRGNIVRRRPKRKRSDKESD